MNLRPKEIEFLKTCASDMVYKQVADKMGKSVRTIENYRDQLFKKFNVTTRTGMVVFAIKNKIIEIQ